MELMDLAELVSHDGNNCAKTKALNILCLLAVTEEPCKHNNTNFQYVSLFVRSCRYKAYTRIEIKFI
jgi:hypothetical protein